MVDAIIEATAQVLIQHGYDGASTNRIAKRAGVSVGSLYQYFPNKKALVSELARRHVQSQLELVASSLATAGDKPLDQVAPELMRAITQAYYLNPDLHKVLVEQAPISDIEDLLRGLEAVVASYIRKNQSQLQVNDPEIAAYMVITLVDGALTRAIRYRRELLDDERLTNALTTLILMYTQRGPGRGMNAP